MPEELRSIRVRIEVVTNKRSVVLDEPAASTEAARERVDEFLSEYEES